uniref:Uncharacterized protein n=1 Tax=Arundo donax TaxID=35708 RepID=A0A0A9CC78_ARUDO
MSRTKYKGNNRKSQLIEAIAFHLDRYANQQA